MMGDIVDNLLEENRVLRADVERLEKALEDVYQICRSKSGSSDTLLVSVEKFARAALDALEKRG